MYSMKKFNKLIAQVLIFAFIVPILSTLIGPIETEAAGDWSDFNFNSIDRRQNLEFDLNADVTLPVDTGAEASSDFRNIAESWYEPEGKTLNSLGMSSVSESDVYTALGLIYVGAGGSKDTWGNKKETVPAKFERVLSGEVDVKLIWVDAVRNNAGSYGNQSIMQACVLASDTSGNAKYVYINIIYSRIALSKDTCVVDIKTDDRFIINGSMSESMLPTYAQRIFNGVVRLSSDLTTIDNKSSIIDSSFEAIADVTTSSFVAKLKWYKTNLPLIAISVNLTEGRFNSYDVGEQSLLDLCTVELSSNNIDFGDPDFLVKAAGGSDNVTDLESSMSSFVGKAISWYVLSKANGNTATLKCIFVNEIIKIFKDLMDQAITEYSLEHEIDESIVNMDKTLQTETDPSKVISSLIQRQLSDIVNKENPVPKMYDTSIKDKEGNRVRVYYYKTDWDGNKFKDVKKDGYVYLSLKELYDGDKLETPLTDVEKSLLFTEYRVVTDYCEISKSSELYSLYEDDSLLNYSNAGIGLITAYPGITDKETADLTKAVQDIIEGFEAPVLTESRMIISSNAFEIGTYLFYQAVYGSTDETSAGIYNVYSKELNDLNNAQNAFGDYNQYWFEKVPKNIRALGSNGEYYHTMLENGYSDTTGWYQFNRVLYNIAQAFAICNDSERGQEYGYTYANLKLVLEELKKRTNYDTEDFNGLAVDGVSNISQELNMNMIKSIISLYDLCEFLGIEPSEWSEDIEQYLSLYDSYQLWNYRDNEFLYSKQAVSQASDEEPMAEFFSINGSTMSSQWATGYSLSSLYIPMETNLYESTHVSWLDDGEWVSDYYYKYGFYRKALYVSTDSSAVVNEYMSGQKSNKMVATLGDLLQYDRDIILYTDSNFYNADDINDVLSKLDYTAIRNQANSATKTDEAGLLDALGSMVTEAFQLDTPTILKTAGNVYYSEALAANATKLGDSPAWDDGVYDVFLFDKDEMFNRLEDYEYSVAQSYAVVSAVYRNTQLYNELLEAIAEDSFALFKSSPTMPSIEGAEEKDYMSYINYIMLSNLQSAMKNDASSQLDLSAPIFTDVFGNIVTESGIVIIPAASNATLSGEAWSPTTLGFATLYQRGNKIPVDYGTNDFCEWLSGFEDPVVITTNPITGETSEKYEGTYNGDAVYQDHEKGSGWFQKGTKYWNLKTSVISSGYYSCMVQWDTISKNNEDLKQIFFNESFLRATNSLYSRGLANNIVEVLRGAPIEYIDYTFEGIEGKANISKAGIYSAYNLNQVVKVLTGGSFDGISKAGNSIITIPNLAFISGVEYIILYLFKIIFAFMVVGMMVTLYQEAVEGSLGFKTIFKFIVTCISVIISITFIPTLMSFTYYNANKSLLRDEIGYIALLNYTKDYDGAEIGITSIDTPESSTELYLKLDDINVDWWTIVSEVLFGDTYSTITELYKDEISDSLIANEDGVIMKGDGLYLSIDDLLDSTEITYSPDYNALLLKNYESDGNVASYVSPYYVILRQMVQNINEYNSINSVSSYSVSYSSNGHVTTYDVISPYLKSDSFMSEGYDILNLNSLFGTGSGKPAVSDPFSATDKTRMQASLWWPDSFSIEQQKEFIDSLYLYARNFVAENEQVIGKVPDEVFIKIMSLQIAIRYNQLFNVPAGKSIEIINVDTKDLLRLMSGTKEDVYKYYGYSYARYVYESGGTIGCILAMLETLVLYVCSYAKPVLMLVLIAMLIYAVLMRKTIFRKQNRAVQGYLIACGALAACNYIYALMLKVTISLADYGFGFVLSYLFGIVVQVVYILLLWKVCMVPVMRDAENVGFDNFKVMSEQVASSILNVKQIVSEKMVTKGNSSWKEFRERRKQISNSDSLNADDNLVGYERLDAMRSRDKLRNESMYD